MSSEDRSPTVYITVSGPPPLYDPEKLRAALLAIEPRFEALRASGLTPQAALRQIEAETNAAAAAGNQEAVVIAENRLRARVEGDVADDGDEFIKLGKEPWNWSLRAQLLYIGVIKHLPRLPFAKDFDL